MGTRGLTKNLCPIAHCFWGELNSYAQVNIISKDIFVMRGAVFPSLHHTFGQGFSRASVATAKYIFKPRNLCNVFCYADESISLSSPSLYPKLFRSRHWIKPFRVNMIVKVFVDHIIAVVLSQLIQAVQWLKSGQALCRAQSICFLKN